MNHFNGKVYSSFSEVPKELLCEGYSSEYCLQHFYDKCMSGAKNMTQDECVSKLILLLNLLLKDGDISVLDYGGGAGHLYWRIEKFLSRANKIAWNVIDVEGTVEWAKSVIQKPKLAFYVDSKSIRSVDVLFARSSIQLVEQFSDILEDYVVSFSPKYIHLDGVSAGSNVEYISLILLDGQRGIPCKLLNEVALVKMVEGMGYTLIDKYPNSIALNMENFVDSQYHLDNQRENNTKGYIFVRSEG